MGSRAGKIECPTKSAKGRQAISEMSLFPMYNVMFEILIKNDRGTVCRNSKLACVAIHRVYASDQP